MAVSFEGVLKCFSTRVTLGLTATPFRKDGDQAIFHMQCGPIRHQMKGSEESRLINKQVIVRESCFRMPPESPQQAAIHEVWNHLIIDENRLELISKDIISTMQAGQFPLVLSERKDHLEKLNNLIQLKTTSTSYKGFLLFGDMGKKERKRTMEGLAECREKGESACLFSTGSLIGEGFDLPELDTLILAMPISFKGRIIQYVGRINRVSEGKSTATVYDYVDINLGLTISMFKKRLPAYKKLGYTIETAANSKVAELVKRARKINMEVTPTT
jgi:superfamily II DNA or RNA helicase